MKKFSFLSLCSAACLCAAFFTPCAQAGEFSPEQLKKMGVFLSNFTECGFSEASRDDFVRNPRMVVRFGMCHHWMNNQKLFAPSKSCGSQKSEFDSYMKIDRKHLESSAARYLDLKFADHRSVPDENYFYDGRN